jgi:hypothetical protein
VLAAHNHPAVRRQCAAASTSAACIEQWYDVFSPSSPSSPSTRAGHMSPASSKADTPKKHGATVPVRCYIASEALHRGIEFHTASSPNNTTCRYNALVPLDNL